MAVVSEIIEGQPSFRSKVRSWWIQYFSDIPLFAWLVGAVVAAILEMLVGNPFARLIGMPRAPVLFGFLIALKTPLLIPPAIFYNIVIYLVPI